MLYVCFGQRFVGIGQWRIQLGPQRGIRSLPYLWQNRESRRNGERILLPGLQLLLPVLDVCCLNLSVMENHQYSNYHHGLPGSGKPEEYSGK